MLIINLMSFQPGILITLFFGHWVGDYLFQTTQMATTKSKSFKWLNIHVLVYTTTILVFSFFILSREIWWRFALLNGILHWITDFFTSKLANHYAGNLRVFYPIIGFDQFIHIATLLLTLYILKQ